MVLGTMPVFIGSHPVVMRASASEGDLAARTAALAQLAVEVASAARDPAAIHDLDRTIRHLERACAELTAAATAMAVSTARDAGRHAGAEPERAAKAAAWRLHHLSHELRLAGDACKVALPAAEALAAATPEPRDGP